MMVKGDGFDESGKSRRRGGATRCVRMGGCLRIME